MTFRYLPVILIPVLIVVSVLVPRSLSFLPAVIALIPYLWYAVREKSLLLPNKSLTLFFISITALASLSYVWSAFPQNTLDRAGTIAGLLFSGLILTAVAQKLPSIDHWPLKPMAVASAISVILLGIFFGIEYHNYTFPMGHALSGEDFMTSMWNRSVVVLVLAAIPTLFLLYKAFPKQAPFFLLGGGILLSLTWPLYFTQSQTAQIMAILALASFGVAIVMRKYFIELSLIVTVAAFFATPWIPGLMSQHLNLTTENQAAFTTKASMPHRLEVWDFVADKILAKPVLGYGVESVRSMKSDEIMPMIKSDTILHPHNAFLQIWVEMGVLGAILGSAFIGFLFWQIRSQRPENRPLYYAAMITSLSLLATGYGLWQSWQVGMLLSLAALSIIATRISAAPKA
jgi:exopolysaccharide production protein ExoQ